MADYGQQDHVLFEEVWTDCELERVEQFYSANFVCHHPPDPDIVGRDGIKKHIARTHSAYDQIRYIVDDHVTGSDQTVTRWRMEGVIKRAVRGAQAEGRTVTITGLSMFRYVDGLIVEEWTYWDQMGLKEQLS